MSRPRLRSFLGPARDAARGHGRARGAAVARGRFHCQARGRRTMNAIEVRHLSRRFGSFVAVNDISFDVRAGEIFGFLGANGAGKSTTIRMLCGLLRPTSGTAMVGGVDVNQDPEGVKRRIGYMSQRFSLRKADRRSEHHILRRHLRLAGDRLAARRGFVLDMAGLRGREHAPAAPSAEAPASRARLRDSPRAADRLSRRTHRRSGPALTPSVLAADQRPVSSLWPCSSRPTTSTKRSTVTGWRSFRRPAGRARHGEGVEKHLRVAADSRSARHRTRRGDACAR